MVKCTTFLKARNIWSYETLETFLGGVSDFSLRYEAYCCWICIVIIFVEKYNKKKKKVLVKEVKSIPN